MKTLKLTFAALLTFSAACCMLLFFQISKSGYSLLDNEGTEAIQFQLLFIGITFTLCCGLVALILKHLND